jgi:hypothetical protein
VTRRPWLVLATLVMLAALATGAILLTRDREQAAASAEPDAAHADGLTLLVVRGPGGPFAAVVGSTGGADGALAIPTEIRTTIPGQGEATIGDALGLPPRQAATAVANLMGVWVDHDAVIGPERLASIVDRSGGIVVGDERLDGARTLELLEEGSGGSTAFQLVLAGLLQAEEVAWEPADLVEADDPAAVVATLEAAAGAPVATLPVVEAATGVFRAEPEAIRAALVQGFGGPDRAVVDVIVLNGSGVPGVGELVAERIVPDGFRVVLSENAANFDHAETLVVVGSAQDVALGERVRDLLGTGSVNVSVSSGIAPVTIVVGKDFAA